MGKFKKIIKLMIIKILPILYSHSIEKKSQIKLEKKFNKIIKNKLTLSLFFKKKISQLLFLKERKYKSRKNSSSLFQFSKLIFPSSIFAIFNNILDIKNYGEHFLNKMSKWSNFDVLYWLQTKSFGKLYTELFKIKKITGKNLMSISNDYLKKVLGIEKLFHRIRLLRDITQAHQPIKIDENDGGSTYSRFCRFQPKEIKIWSETSKFLKIREYGLLFKNYKINGEQFILLNSITLKYIGVKIKHIKHVLQEIDDLKNGFQEAITRINNVWKLIFLSKKCYNLLYKHLKPLDQEKNSIYKEKYNILENYIKLKENFYNSKFTINKNDYEKKK